MRKENIIFWIIIVLVSGCAQTVSQVELNANNFNFDLVHDDCSPDGKTASPDPGIVFTLPKGKLFDISCTVKIDGKTIPNFEIYRSLPKAQRTAGEPTTEKVELIGREGRYYLYHDTPVGTDGEHEFTVCCNGFCDTETVDLAHSCWYQREHPSS